MDPVEEIIEMGILRVRLEKRAWTLLSLQDDLTERERELVDGMLEAHEQMTEEKVRQMILDVATDGTTIPLFQAAMADHKDKMFGDGE